tara:strand:+ start:717 stop:1016 length:300 start_codon:yes stop_codon:yes gene_type:complete
MINNIIIKLPPELVNEVLSFHPYFFKFKRKYIKSVLVNDLFHKDSIIKKSQFDFLTNKYSFSYIDMYLHKQSIIYSLMICFESNIFDEQEISLDNLITD